MTKVVAIALAGMCLTFIGIQSRRGVSESRVNGQMDSDGAVDIPGAGMKKPASPKQVEDLFVLPDGKPSFIELSEIGMMKDHGDLRSTDVKKERKKENWRLLRVQLWSISLVRKREL